VSVDGPDDWRAWCEAERFNLQNLLFKININLHPDANILHLQSSADLLIFTDGYGAKESQVNSIMKSHSLGRTFHIDWPQVAREYDGIIIAPYQWPMRMELMWYYPWDCASGCIWNMDAVQSTNIEWAHTLKHGLRYTVHGWLARHQLKRLKRKLKTKS
jgi:hypothetical protein